MLYFFFPSNLCPVKEVLGDVLRISGGLEAEGLVDDFVLSTRPSLSHASDVSLV